ncbi:site-specific tyrosine recombinase/integron integrase [Bacillus infantis]|uniref:Tyrosine-type recombinase/integrase n=1 Tax=Bacillus infantis TaxID=324767 RepID=A0A5D4R5W8_9BACI|nr:site-specific tyrosine recombinase/integron integrase [Bacillus infantis]TYS46767.1 tyrosine-type recombinase/integrase [Bacillus infantis]
MNNSSEQLLTDVVGYISELVPINVDDVRNRLSVITSKYHVQRVEEDETHPDLYEKISFFLSTKKLEGLSSITLEGYDLELKLFAEKIKKKAENVSAADIRVYLGSLQGLKMSTIGRKLSVLKSFFSWLASEEIIPRDPTAKLKSPKTEKRMPKALTIEELELLRESCQTVRQRAFIEVLYATGCRLSEIHQLDRNSINIQSMSTNVVGKGNKEREVYFSFKAMYHLRKYLGTRTDDCEALMVTHRKPYRRLTKRGIQREIAAIAKNAGLQSKVSPHVLRHTFASLTLNNGAEITAVQELLGHSSPDTTLRYARITEERKREQHKKHLVL